MQTKFTEWRFPGNEQQDDIRSQSSGACQPQRFDASGTEITVLIGLYCSQLGVTKRSSVYRTRDRFTR